MFEVHGECVRAEALGDAGAVPGMQPDPDRVLRRLVTSAARIS